MDQENKKISHAQNCMTSHAKLHGIVVMAEDSQSKGPGFESWHFQNLFCQSFKHPQIFQHIYTLVLQLQNFSHCIQQLLAPPGGEQ